MKHILCFVCAIALFKYSLGQGVIFDSTSFSQQQEFPIERASLPAYTSLERYLPALYPQTGGTCVAMSTALARTIMLANSLGATDIATITRIQMSPYFIYYHARNSQDFSCNEGLNPIRALMVAKEIGFERFARIEYPNHFPFTSDYLCPKTYNYLPPKLQDHLANAKAYRISDFYVTKSKDGIKSALAKGFPVIVAMQVPESFQMCRSDYWKSTIYETKNKAFGHAMVVVGFNDNYYGGSFRVVNSWGTSWGDNGKIWINYSELEYWLDGAFIMIPASSSYKLESISQQDKYKMPKVRNFKADEYNGKFDFINKDYLQIFSTKE